MPAFGILGSREFFKLPLHQFFRSSFKDRDPKYTQSVVLRNIFSLDQFFCHDLNYVHDLNFPFIEKNDARHQNDESRQQTQQQIGQVEGDAV